MANFLLFKSTLFFSIFHLLMLNQYEVPVIFMLMILINLATSVINHGLTDNFFVYLDRFTISIGIIIDFYYIVFHFKEFMLFVLLCQSIILYILAKMTRNDFYHLLSHCVITYLHIIMIYFFQ